MEKYLKPALICGGIAGVVSAIPFIGICGCLWLIVSVILAAMMYRKEVGFVDIVPGLTLGAITGAIEGLISGVLGIIVTLVFGNWYEALVSHFLSSMNAPYMSMRGMSAASAISSVVGLFTGIIVATAIGTLTGLVIGAIWKKPNQQPEVPPIETTDIQQ